jgi:hypothetical protein
MVSTGSRLRPLARPANRVVFTSAIRPTPQDRRRRRRRHAEIEWIAGKAIQARRQQQAQSPSLHVVILKEAVRGAPLDPRPD